MRRTRAFPRAPVLFLTALLPAVLPAQAMDVEVRSETILRFFDRDTAAGGDQKVVPVYEYVQLAAGELEGKGLSLHAYGWGRADLADNEYFDEQAQGEFLYGYIQYTHEEANFSAQLGRQYVFEGVSNESVDGLRVGADLGSLFSGSVYAGQPVALEEVGGRDGDRIYGGRLANHWGRLYEIGVSYKRVDNDGDKQEEVLGMDSSLSAGTFADLHGTSVRNLGTDQWQEHSYEARIPVRRFILRPHFQRFDYAAYFDTGVNTGSPFRFLADSQETVTVLGGDVTWNATAALELGARAKRYTYREREENAWYYAGLATWHLQSLSQVGGEVGRMDGDTEDTAYTQVRGFFYHDMSPGFVSGDAVYVRYDADILDEGRSVFASLSGGMRFLEEKLEVSLSGDYSADPYFDRDLRGMLNVKYLFQL
ncbi:MAG: hypothetical protein P1P84_15210 [Deferrisomatales bacterium]|nr:hypothetical protein [Deferrisomatales bacterium]